MTIRHYRIVVQGQLGETFATAFDGMTQATQGRDTVLEGRVGDQPQLNGIFDQLRRLGIEVRSFDTEARPSTQKDIHE